MPVYCYTCEKCGCEWEEYKNVDDRDKENCCGQKAKRVLSVPAKPVILEYYSESLDAMVTGPRQKSQLMKEKNVREIGNRNFREV